MAEFHRVRDQYDVRGIVGPLGSSKTFGAINEMLLFSHNQSVGLDGVRKSRWCVARNSFPDLNAATIPDVRSIVDKINPDGWRMAAPISWHHRYPRQDGTEVEIEIQFRSFDGPQDDRKARGMQLTGVWIDEAGEFVKKNLDMLLGRVGRYPVKVDTPNAKFTALLTSNAVARDHWMAKACLGKPQPGWWWGIQPGGVIRQGDTWVTNPAAENLRNLPDGYYTKQLANKKESWIRQNLANEFVVHSDGRAIHPDFSETMHVRPLSYNPGLPIYLGMDWGRTPAAVVAQQYPNGSWRVLREICLTNAGADKLGTRVKTVLNAEFDGAKIANSTGDPAGTAMAQTRDETPFELFELKSGIPTLPASTNDPETRYAVLDDQLSKLIEGEPAILIDPSCELLIRGLAGEYEFRRIQVSNREEYKDTPSKGPTSHICEALHYLLMGAGEGEALFNSADDGMFDEIDSWAQPDYLYE
jgi:hypothetical protein